MTALYLAEMGARVTELAAMADCTDDETIRAYLRQQAIDLDRWAEQISRDAVQAHRMKLALDYIAEDERQAALAAEERARQAAQNPGRGPSPAANCPSTAAGASDPGRGTLSLRTIDSVIAAAHGGRVVEFRRPAPRVVRPCDTEPAA